MIRLGCDSAVLGNLIHTDFVFPYADQLDRGALAALGARFPGSEIVPIDRGLGDPLGVAGIIDVERGARRPADCPDWFDQQHAAGLRWLTAYASLDKMAEVEKHLGDRPWWRWYAYWDAGLWVPGHPDAMIQFASGAQLGAGVDLTLVHNTAWHPRRGHLPPGIGDRVASLAGVAGRAHDAAMGLYRELAEAV